MFEQLELLIVIKWSEGEFESSVMPVKVKVFWSVIMVLLVLYPTIKFGLPALNHHRHPKQTCSKQISASSSSVAASSKNL